MSRFARGALTTAGLLLAVALLLPAAADWLVTRGGTRIETVGPWRVESRLVVFKRPDGTYASMRASEIDLEASERLTREMEAKAQAPPEEPEPRERPVVARLTEKDLPSVGRPETEETEGEEGSELAGEAAGGSPDDTSARPAEPLAIDNWRELSSAESEGVDFTGTVRNRSDATALGVEVTVTLYDEADEELSSTNALLTSTALPPGQSAGFRASFPRIFHYVRVEFQVRGQLLDTEPSEEPGEEPPPGRR